MMKQIRIAAVAAIAVLLAGCNTMEGLGQDLSTFGDALSEASRDAKGSHSSRRTADDELAGGPTYSRRP